MIIISTTLWWIRKVIITNATYINQKYLTNGFITIFDEKFKVIRSIESNKIDISKNYWKIFNAKVYKENDYVNQDQLSLKTNFDLKRIQTLYSNLSALSIIDLYELRKNYKLLNSSTTEIELHLLKLISYPIFLLLMALFSSVIMLNIKNIRSFTFKILIGLFFSVLIYYLNNFSYVLGSTERIPVLFSIVLPLLILLSINSLMLYKVNEK